MSPHVYVDALNKALNAELMQWGGNETTGRRRGRAIAALVLGATTVVGTTEELPAVTAPIAPTATEAIGSPLIVPAHFRPAADRWEIVGRVLANARIRVENDTHAAQAVATLSLEIERLQRDLGLRSQEGMEEAIGLEYASLEAVRRALADAVVDDEELPVVAVALDRASELLPAAA